MNVNASRIVGGVRPLEGAAPFAAAAVVLTREDAPNEFLQVTRYEADGSAHGKLLSAEEWDSLVASGQAQRVANPVSAVSGAWMWLMRKGFEGREAALSDLRRSGALLEESIDIASGTWTLIVLEPIANPLRERWSEQAYTSAVRAKDSGLWERARDMAEFAFVLERSLRAENIALLAFVYEKLGRATRSEGYVEMARRSRGDAFADEIKTLWKAFGKESEGPPASGIQQKYANSFRNRNRHIIERSRNKLGSGEGKAA